jgi:uncharacterized protein (DUF1684 family)/thiol-disulfide isomerase/thioredoxin
MSTEDPPRARRLLAPAAVLIAVALSAVAFRTARDRAGHPTAARADTAAYRAEWETWKSRRAKALLTPGRPLSYTALSWLHPGRSTIGASARSDVRLAGRGVPATVGTLIRSGDRIRFEPGPGVAVTVDSQPATAGLLRTDADSLPSQVRVGSAGFRIAKRVDSIGVRAWDAEHPSLRAFAGLSYFPLDQRWRIAGRFTPLPVPRTIAAATESGVAEEYVVVGSVDATVDGTPYTLTAYRGGGKQLFITFADASSGEETYGFRFLRATVDSATRDVALDFNFAYNPDCAFSRFTTCPLPPPENRIRTKVLAGERPPQKGLRPTAGDAGTASARTLSEYRATALSGAPVALGGAGGPLTLVNVWATWCTSCREEMQDLSAIHHDYAPRGLRVVAVSVDAGSETLVRRFVQREQLPFPVVHDQLGTIQKQYGIVGVPTSYLIGADGRLLWQQVGGVHGNLPAVRAEVEQALRS